MHAVVEGQKLHLTPHAILRYCERFKHLHDPTRRELDRAAEELATLLQQYGRLADSPPWSLSIPAEEYDIVHQTTCYVLVGDDICIPAEQAGSGLVGVTVLARGSISELRRQRRNSRKQEKRARASARRQNESYRGERAPRWY